MFGVRYQVISTIWLHTSFYCSYVNFLTNAIMLILFVTLARKSDRSIEWVRVWIGDNSFPDQSPEYTECC